MGLTVHYELQLPPDRDEAGRVMYLLHQRIEQLPVQSVSPLALCNKPKPVEGFTRGEEEVRYSGRYGGTCIAHVYPNWACGFFAEIGPGCESLGFQLYGYPTTVRIHSDSLRKSYRVIKVNKPNLIGYDFCKTEYAGSPQNGGPEHFLKCHLLVVRALEIAQVFGLVKQVQDESGYWTSYELRSLLQASGVKQFRELPFGWGPRLVALGLLPDGLAEHLMENEQNAQSGALLSSKSRLFKSRVILR